MKCTMLVSISGTRDGNDWPAAGETIDLPEPEATGLIAAGMAASVGSPVETTDAPAPAETAAVDTKPGKRRRG